MQAFGFARGYELFGYGLLIFSLAVIGAAIFSLRRVMPQAWVRQAMLRSPQSALAVAQRMTLRG